MIVPKSANPILFSLIPAQSSFLIKTRSINPLNKIPYLLDGPKGIGKSCELSLISYDWLQKGGIVMFESALGMVNGSYPYSSLGNTLDTPELSLSILNRFKTLNKLEKHPNLNSLIGKANDSNASQILSDLLDILSETRQVLLVIDQVNALYSKSCYFDQDSNQLYSHKLHVANLIQKVIKSNKIQTLLAQDYTNTNFPAFAFQDLMEKNGGFSKPSSLNVSKDEFPRDLLPENVIVERLNSLSKDQVQEWIQILVNQSFMLKA